ncbi:hypothetical protein Tco_0953233 [Tanacetum coccineum]|uniref:Uncharacterized protein n=1 Tax=Tanacetum coccineum TaxID=301880 RepID=A0ABQ5E236_9ASTR
MNSVILLSVERIMKMQMNILKGFPNYKGAIPTMNAANAKKAIQDMDDHSQKWHNGTSSMSISNDTSDGLAAIQA